MKYCVPHTFLRAVVFEICLRKPNRSRLASSWESVSAHTGCSQDVHEQDVGPVLDEILVRPAHLGFSGFEDVMALSMSWL